MENADPSSVREREASLVACPSGVAYRVVLAPSGLPLREWSAANDLSSIVVELLAGLILEARAQDTTGWKIGVFRSRRWGYEKLLLKEQYATRQEATDRVGHLADEITAGRAPGAQLVENPPVG